MTRKRIALIALIVLVPAGVFIMLAVLDKPRVVPELIGTWEIDAEATRNHKNNASATKKEMDESIGYYTDDNSRFTYTSDGRMICTYDKEGIRKQTEYRVRFIRQEGNKITLDVERADRGQSFITAIKEGGDDEDDYEEICIYGPGQLSFNFHSDEWIVLKRVGSGGTEGKPAGRDQKTDVRKQPPARRGLRPSGETE
jgi:hypothetical protein